MKISRRTAVATIGTSLLLPKTLFSATKPEVPETNIRHLGRHKKLSNLPKIRAMMHLMDLGMTDNEFQRFRDSKDWDNPDGPIRLIDWHGWFREQNQDKSWVSDDGFVWPWNYVWLSLCCTAVRTHDMIGWLNGEEATTPEERYERLLRGVR